MSVQRREYVAVIDDSTDLMELFTDALAGAGFKVHGFNDPLKAIEHLNKHHSEYLLVLTDIRMPGMDGLQLSRLVHQVDKEIKIICMSAFEYYDSKLEEIEIEAFIKKPIHVADLVNVIKENLMPTQIQQDLV